MSDKNIEFLEKMDLSEDEDISNVILKSKKDLFFLKRKRSPNVKSSFNRISKEREESFLIKKSYDFNFDNKDKNNYNIKSNLDEINFNEQLNQITNNLSKIDDKTIFNSNYENLNKDENKINENQNINNSNYLKDLYKLTSNLKENEPGFLNINEKINDEKNISINSNNISNNNINNNNLKKNIFNVTLIDENNEKLFNNYNSNNNEVRVLKNNKVVYVNSSLLNNYYTYKNLKIVEKASNIGKSKRSSKYRGVSKNGNQWQVLIMLDKNKSYIRSYSSEYIAARVYDILAIKSKGFKARTNFIYDYEQISKIIEMDIDIKAKNINEIISNLFG